MAKTVPLTLVNPLKGTKSEISVITITEPNFRICKALGDPDQFAETGDGSLFRVEKDEVIAAYMEKCCDVEPLLLMQLSLVDYLAIKKAIIGFFDDARQAISKRSQNT